MDVSMLQLPPGDPGLIDKIVCQLKSNGIFDQFRKECIADVDTKPAYQNLRQRVEGSVSSFLSNQEWRPDLNKNQLRDSLRKHIHESGFLDIGVERIVDQVVNPKMYTVFFPKVEDVVYGFLGLEKPKKGTDVSNSLHFGIPKLGDSKPEKKFVSLKDLLPTDLDPISPEKLDSDEEDIDEPLVNKEVEDFGSTKEVSTPKVKEEVENGQEDEGKGVEEEEDDEDEEEEEEEEEDEEEASPPFESLDIEAQQPSNAPLAPLPHSADMLDNITSSSSSSEIKDVLQFGETRRRESKEEEQSSSSATAEKAVWVEDGGHEQGGMGEEEEVQQQPRGDGAREEGPKEEEGARKEGRKKEEEEVEGGGGKSRGEKARAEEEATTTGQGKDKGGAREGEGSKRGSRRDDHHHHRRHHHHGSSSSSRRGGSSGEKRREGSGKEDGHWKKERGHSEKGGGTSSSSGGGAGRRGTGGEKTSSTHHSGGGHHHRHRSSSSSGHHHGDKEKKLEVKEKKGSGADDHRYERDKKGRDGHRRWDRDRERSREGRGGEGSKQSAVAGASSSSSGGGSKGGSGSSKGGGGSKGGTSECEQESRRALPPGGPPVEAARRQQEEEKPGAVPCDTAPKVKKPKIAANVYEVKKIIQARKRLEREMGGKGGGTGEEEGKRDVGVASPPPVQRERREGKWEGGCGRGPEGEGDAEWGEVLYLEEVSKDVEFVSYVHRLSRDAAAGDLSRVLVVGSMLDDDVGPPSSDFVELSDVDLSREEEEILRRLGAHVERRKGGEGERAECVNALVESTKFPSGEEGGKRPRRPNPRYNSGEYSTYSDEEVGGLLGGEGSEGEEEDEEGGPQNNVESSLVAEGKYPSSVALDGGEGLSSSVGPRRRRGAVVGRRLGVRGPLRRVATPDAFTMPLSPESDVSTASGDAGRKTLLMSKEGNDAELASEEFESEGRRPLPPTFLMTAAVAEDGYPHSTTECDSAQAEGIVLGSVVGHPSCRMEDGDQRRHDESPVSLGTRRMRGTRSSSRVQQRYSSDDLYKPRPNITLGRRNRGKNSPSQEDLLEGGGEEEGRERSPVVEGDMMLTAGPAEAPAGAVDCLPNKKRRR